MMFPDAVISRDYMSSSFGGEVKHRYSVTTKISQDIFYSPESLSIVRQSVIRKLKDFLFEKGFPDDSYAIEFSVVADASSGNFLLSTSAMVYESRQVKSSVTGIEPSFMSMDAFVTGMGLEEATSALPVQTTLAPSMDGPLTVRRARLIHD